MFQIGLKKFLIKKVKNTVSWSFVISDRKGGEILEPFMKKNCKETNPKEVRVDKVIKSKGDKLYVKWIG